ncbi:MAG: PH domain-containing protein [Cyanobacteria bacterium J06621_8]
MFKRIAADALGLSDIGIIVKPEDYDKVESDDFILQEDKETIFFLIKSQADEYCFTNKALIHVDGTSAVSKRRSLKRFDYSDYQIQNVVLETAGTIDLDIEIKFTIGSHPYSIDVHKKHLAELKHLYKSLIKISTLQKTNAEYLKYAHSSLEIAAKAVDRSTSDQSIEQEFKKVNEYAFEWLTHFYATYSTQDFTSAFETFLPMSNE